MATWIQSLSWTLIYALGQGFLVNAALWLVLKLVSGISANVKYHLSLSALTILLAWFIGTWWQQFHLLANEQTILSQQVSLQQQLHATVLLPQQDGYSTLLSSLYTLLPWLSVFYVIGLVLMVARLSAGVLQLFSLRRSGLSQPDAMFNDLLRSLKSTLHLDSPVQLFISAKAQVPMVIGFLKPMILMPAAAMAQLSTQQLETILLHELAHIKRYDYLINILQTVVETILFFNPFVWMISSITRREREHCCDDLVLQHTHQPLLYATALAALATHPTGNNTFAVAATGPSNHLFNRIKRIMEMKKNPFSYSRMVAAILIIAVITGSVVWLTPSFAKSKDSKETETTITTTKTTTTSSKPVIVTDEMLTNQQETNILAQRLMDDKLVNQITGFSVVKRNDKLIINGKEQPAEVAGKYLANIKQKEINIMVYSLDQRIKMHPNVSLIQLLAPMTFSSPCVDTKPKKDGC